MTKEKWIKAYELTLSEYENGTHICDDFYCAKCKLCKVDGTTDCRLCPEFAHHSTSYGSCLARNSYPTQNPSPKELVAVVEYHKLAIDFFKTLPEENFMASDFSELKTIDSKFDRTNRRRK